MGREQVVLVFVSLEEVQSERIREALLQGHH